MKKKLFIILAIVIVLGGIVYFGIKYFNQINGNGIDSEYVISYVNHYKMKSYNIKPRKDYIYVERNEIVECNTVPCSPVKIDDFKVEYTDDYKELLEKIIENKDNYRKDNFSDVLIYSDDLTSDELFIMSKLVKERS